MDCKNYTLNVIFTIHFDVNKGFTKRIVFLA